MSRSQFVCGQSWTGDLPEGWKPLKAKRVFAQSKLRAKPGDVQLSVTQKQGIVAQEELIESGQRVVLALSGTDNFKHVEVDDFVISLRSFQGGIERSTLSGCVSPAYTVLRAERPISPSYWGYLFKSAAFITALRSVIDEGIRDGKSITYEQFGEATTPFPPICEQEAIASYLDRATSRIDTLVAKKTRFIELLREKRQALITHAVTKGLDPNVPMKDSGIEWLGKIPAHWATSKLAYVASEQGGKTPTTTVESYWGGDIPWVTPKDMKTNEIFGSIDHISNTAIDGFGMKMIDPGAVLVVVRGMILNHSFPVAELKVHATINQDMKALTPIPELNPTYLRLLLGSFRKYVVDIAVAEAAHGTRVLRTDIWRLLPVLIPGIQEQQLIVSHLDRATTRIDTLIAKTEHSIELLREHRAALITAAVTGKVDLRTANG